MRQNMHVVKSIFNILYTAPSFKRRYPILKKIL